ncbi:MAG: hypothetical protein UR34_C0010G0024 [candidate division WS6 bacterium GW2011_GWC1_33_20]|uniref:Uncharacterized protein n=1 Tax=candidate division WS6 bacterium GW2011_GWC1_33_20 TaxID=1619089 RepID=A0A0F9ZID1_9BACT|nr:MAG: hypothetical protein UR32_C0019G0014 [candidate division WS6 bacterium GW2011_GWE2_33_157]KKP43859.1 MAG: hypothetical protein UR34_C0010G0024 [candidate division WS6 bacterium GW2011_GWC1_33_20]KKP44350.1 MAG: hypothetical protein UR36_C0018G0015 [candidate division WS6 bacterium GW2011_GWF1_33_233]KKP54835.1 MAG: hypothetical protein UR45_C0008G0013 [candidate division WS6 bacterium GW2011_WS6_33_547]KKP55839.1 MAG: hypothetical protein UR49_C0027G0005 [candidate division WS6 bacteriu
MLGINIDINYDNQYISEVVKVIDKPFTYLQKTLSEQTYNNITNLVDTVLTVAFVLLAIYIVYSTLHFLSGIFSGKFRLRVLISIIISLAFFFLIYLIDTLYLS